MKASLQVLALFVVAINAFHRQVPRTNSKTDCFMSQKSQIPESSPQSIRSGQLNNVQQGIQILTKSLLVTSVVSQYGSPSESNAAVIDEFKLKDLPYLYSALEPFISEKTLRFHHLKHHAKYISTTNSLVKGTEYEGLDLEKVLKKAYVAKNQGLFNNAAQSYNHEFYWNSMKPPSDVPSTPSSKLLQAIDKSFGSLDDFKKQFKAAGLATFGSGWVWLVTNKSKGGALEILKTIGAENPLVSADTQIPLLTMDVWEHAYYLDYQNERNRYEDAFVDKLINWDFVSTQYKLSM